MEEKKIPKEIRMITCGMLKHIHNSRPATSPHHPPTHPPSTTMKSLHIHTRRNFYTDEILREGLCEKDILRERDFERRTFCEKGILREEWIWFTDLKNESIDWFFKSVGIKIDRSIRVKRFPKSLTKEDFTFLDRSEYHVRTCVGAHKSLESVNSEFYCTYIAQTGMK